MAGLLSILHNATVCQSLLVADCSRSGYVSNRVDADRLYNHNS